MIQQIGNAVRYARQGTLVRNARRYVERKRAARREKWWNSQRNKVSVIVRVGRNAKLRLPFDSVLGRLIYCGTFEQDVQVFIERFLRKGDVFVDVGANIGLFTVIASELVGSEGQVHAFEPVKKTFDRLQENVEVNRFENVTCHQIAISDEVRQLEMVISTDGHDAWNSLGVPTMGNAESRELVQCVRWDDVALKYELEGCVTMMKIDVEGWEQHVIQGGLTFFASAEAPTLVVEFTDDAARRAGSSCSTVYGMLEKLGYRLFSYSAEANDLSVQPPLDRFEYVNLIASKRPDEVRARLHRRDHG
jgi:FkbM family methyltransferase